MPALQSSFVSITICHHPFHMIESVTIHLTKQRGHGNVFIFQNILSCTICYMLSGCLCRILHCNLLLSARGGDHLGRIMGHRRYSSYCHRLSPLQSIQKAFRQIILMFFNKNKSILKDTNNTKTCDEALCCLICFPQVLLLIYSAIPQKRSLLVYGHQSPKKIPMSLAVRRTRLVSTSRNLVWLAASSSGTGTITPS